MSGRRRRPQIGRVALSDNVAAATLRLAVQKGLGAGDALPPVTALADDFEVSRVVVREALDRLQQQGAVAREGRRWVLTSKPKARKVAPAAVMTLDGRNGHGDSVSHRSLADQVADAVLDLILTRRLREGDQLPPSGELAEQFGVSLIVMREALASLAARGLVRRRQGRESVVALPSHELVSSILRMRAYLSDIDVDEFQSARGTLEVQAAALAARHAGPADHQRLLELVEAMRRAGPSEEEFNERDLEFHTLVAQLSGNRAIELLLASLNDIVRLTLDVGYRRTISRAGAEGIAHAVANHERVASAIIDADPVAAAAAMHEHFTYVAPGNAEPTELAQA